MFLFRTHVHTRLNIPNFLKGGGNPLRFRELVDIAPKAWENFGIERDDLQVLTFF